MKIYFCTRRQLYFGQPCEQHPASLTYGHPDIDVSDALTLDDLDSRDLGHDLARVRYEQRAVPDDWAEVTSYGGPGRVFMAPDGSMHTRPWD